MYKTEQSVKLIRSSSQISHLDNMRKSDLHFLQRPTQPATAADGKRERTSGQVHHGACAVIQLPLSTLSSCINCCWKYNVCWSTGTSNSKRMTVFKSATVSSYRKATIVYMHIYTNTACLHCELHDLPHRDDSQSLNAYVTRNTKPPRRHETTCKLTIWHAYDTAEVESSENVYMREQVSRTIDMQLQIFSWQ